MVDDAKRAEDEADLAEARLHKLDTELYELTRRRGDAHRRRRARRRGGARSRAGACCRQARAETLELRDEIKADAEKLRLAREERARRRRRAGGERRESAERASRRGDAVAATGRAQPASVPEKTREPRRCSRTPRRRCVGGTRGLGARVAALESEMEAQSERVVRMAETARSRAGAGREG